MTKSSDLHRRWRKDSDSRHAYDALGEKFDLAQLLIEARMAARLSQHAGKRFARDSHTSPNV